MYTMAYCFCDQSPHWDVSLLGPAFVQYVSFVANEALYYTYPLPWASGLPVAIQCPWNLDPSVQWNATRERNVGSQCVPLWFQWSSSGFPVVFQCVPIMQINTGLPLEHHWVLASASVVPMAFQCTCGSKKQIIGFYENATGLTIIEYCHDVYRLPDSIPVWKMCTPCHWPYHGYIAKYPLDVGSSIVFEIPPYSYGH